MKRILINDISYSNNAIRTAVISKIKYWQKHGCVFTIFTTHLGSEFYKKYLQGVNFVVLPYENECSNKLSLAIEYSKRNFISLFFINKLRNKYDIVYSLSSVLDLVLLPYFLRIFDKKIRWVALFENAVYFSEPGNRLIRFLSWIFFHISLCAFRKADFLLPISDTLREYLASKHFDRNKLQVSGNGVEVDLIKEARKDKKFNIGALFIGRINEAKGIYDLLKVLIIVKEKYPDFQLAIMGTGDKKTEINFKNKIKKLSLEENIQFLGYKTGLEKFNIIKSSKCFWFLSVSGSESFGIALLEAVCCGLPAFAYDLKPYKNIYKNNEVMIFPKYDFKSVAMKVIELFEKGEFNNKSGELLLDKYSWNKVAEIEFNAFNNL